MMRFNWGFFVAIAATTMACEIHSGAAAGPWDSTPPAPTGAGSGTFTDTPHDTVTGTVDPGLHIASIRRVSDTTVEIRGTGFGPSGSVALGGSPITFVSWTDTAVTIALPSIAPGQHPVTLTTGGKTSNAVTWIAGPTPSCDGAVPADPMIDDWTPASAPAYVAVSFDGGYASHASTRLLDALDALGIRASFFVSTALIGAGSPDTFADRADEAGLARIAARGHEIGGHSLHGADLLTLDATQVENEICADRARLFELGFAPTTFAYPHGRSSDAMETFVARCGYAGARTGHTTAEERWPSSTFALGGTSFTCRDSVEGMRNAIRNLEATGGFTSVVFHDLCDGHCSADSTNVDDVVAFLGWLESRAARGTYVRTLGDVVAPRANER
jgi:peptidoglycan/xylan/chitin deacetylase (PgdA/CDA1 family)